MKNRYGLKVCLYIVIFILLIFVAYRIYLIAFETDFNSLNIDNIDKVQKLEKKEAGFSFAVTGNIKNSIDVFDTKLVRKINNDNLDFVISTGNAVWDGAEDKYRVLNKSLKKVKVPVIMGIGDNEVSDGGTLRFYKHFGPLYFSFSIGDSYFIFLDTTGETAEAWQREWLGGELINAQKYKYRFIFMNRPPYEIEGNYIKSASYRQFLKDNFLKYKVTAVFASGAEIYDHRDIEGVPYYISGGGGGRLLVNNEDSFYHYIKVDVKPDKVSYSIVKQEKPLAFLQLISNIWVYVHSIFYINFINFILVLSLLIFAGILIYNKITEEVDYFRSFAEESGQAPDNAKLNIAMFTNNYFPFVGGVPISIERLAKGLTKQGHRVYIFAPEYPVSHPGENDDVIRCKLLFYHKTSDFNFPIVNIFSRDIEREFAARQIDVVHIHHPYWMGSKGIEMAKKYKVPAIFTYHTRLDKYVHYIPVFARELFKNKVSHYMVRKFSNKCDAIFAPTYTIKEYLRNIGVSKYIEILPTGIDIEGYNSIETADLKELKQNYKRSNEIVLCSVSRLAKEKNLDFLLEGAKYIKEHTNIPFKLIIIGEGPERENLLKTIETGNLKDIVILIGEVSPREVYKYYVFSDIFVFASQSETQGMVLLEAMAGHCPVVAVRSSGIDDIISNYYNGFKTKADVQVWAERIVNLMKNPDRRTEMSKNAYAFSESFSIEQMAECATKVYFRAIENKKAILAEKGCNNG